MSIHEAEAIVLRQYALAEADRIIVLFTREQGVLRATAQGARKPRSRLGGCLEPLTHVRLQYYRKEGAELARIWHCEIVRSYLGRNPTLDRLYGFSYLAELVLELVPEHAANPLMFRLLLSVLDTGEPAGVNPALLRYFEFWALRLNGWLPDYDYCPDCGKCVKDNGFYAWLEAGQGRCRDCARGRGVKIGPEAAHLLGRILELSPGRFTSLSQTDSAARELEILAQSLMEWHLEKRLKSYTPLREVLRNG